MDSHKNEKMDENDKRVSFERGGEKKITEISSFQNSNTEYLPTKCRITKPPPPKPATNPLQFVKVTTCPLTIKAQEQLKKVEEIKIAKKEVRDDAEDWQAVSFFKLN